MLINSDKNTEKLYLKYMEVANMKVVEGLKYSKDHEWVKVDGNKVYVGISDHAQHSLGDIVFVEIPEQGMDVNKGDILSVVESVKAASDIYAPVSGKVIKVNEELEDSPEKINVIHTRAILLSWR